jgi:hypothetical protein
MTHNRDAFYVTRDAHRVMRLRLSDGLSRRHPAMAERAK